MSVTMPAQELRLLLFYPFALSGSLVFWRLEVEDFCFAAEGLRLGLRSVEIVLYLRMTLKEGFENLESSGKWGWS